MEFKHGGLFVGTYSYEIEELAAEQEMLPAEAAMFDAMNHAGPVLTQLSDGETGSRKDWIVGRLESYRENPAFEVAEDGDWSGYQDVPRFRVAAGHTLVPDDFRLRYHGDAFESWETFKRVRSNFDRPDLKFQVGIPHPLDMSLFTFGLPEGGEQRGLDPALIQVCQRATLDEIEAISDEEWGTQVVFQIETPASLSAALIPEDVRPAQLQPESLGEGVAELASKSPDGSVFGVHLCWGDLNNQSRPLLRSRAASVMLMNEISGSWQDNTRLKYIHDPIGGGKTPPMADRRYYDDLQHLQLKEGTRYVAGMVHERQSLVNQRKVLSHIVDALPKGQAVDIAAPCGLGRRPLRTVQRIGRRMMILAR